LIDHGLHDLQVLGAIGEFHSSLRKLNEPSDLVCVGGAADRLEDSDRSHVPRAGEYR
jgi:hypothetical protein